MRKIITNSMRTCFLDCQFKFFCEYVRRLSPIKEPGYFRWGSLVHICAEYQDLGESVDDAIEVFRKQIETRPHTPKVLEETEDMCNLAPAVADAHFLRWHKEDEFYEHVGVETKFKMPLPCGWEFRGKIDKKIRDIRTGEVHILERKTAASITEDYWANIMLDSQPKGYILAAQEALGLDVHKVLYDLYGKPQIRLRKNEMPAAFQQRLADTYLHDYEKYFQRRLIPFTQDEIDDYKQDLDGVAQDIEAHLISGRWSKHHPQNRFGACAFLPICTRGDESGYFVRSEKSLNPELVN